MKKPRQTRPVISRDYFDLVQAFPLIPIRNDRHLRQAFEMIDRLSILDEERMTSGQAEYLLVLSELVERYESDRHALDLAHLDAVDVLKHLLEQHGMRASDLGRVLGNRQLGSAILRRQRELSKAHIAKLASRFSVAADLFLREKTAPKKRSKAA